MDYRGNMDRESSVVKKASENSTLGGLFWKFGERITAQIVTTIVSIVLMRIIEPADYGVIALVTIAINVCNSFVVGGLGNSLIQKKDADDLDFNSIFYISIAFSIVLYFVMFVLSTPIASFYNNIKLVLILRIMSIRLPIAAINSVQHAYISRTMQFKKFFIATLFGTIVSGVVGILMALHGYGIWALVAQYLTNVTIDTLVLFFVGGWTPRFMFSFERLKKLLPYGFKLMGASVLDTLFNEIRSIIISTRYSSVDLAMYENGKKYPNLIVTNINTSISSVMFPVMSKQQENKDILKSTMKKSIKLCTFCLAPLLIGLFACGDRFVDVILTSKWLPSVPYLRMMCIMCLFYPIHTVNIQALNAVGESGLTLKLELIKKAINISLLLITMFYGVLWIAIGAMVVSLLSTYINAAYSKKQFNYSFLDQMKDIFPTLLLAFVMALAVIVFDNYIKMNGILMLIYEVLLGALIFVGGAHLFRFQELTILKDKLAQLMNKTRR